MDGGGWRSMAVDGGQWWWIAVECGRCVVCCDSKFALMCTCVPWDHHRNKMTVLSKISKKRNYNSLLTYLLCSFIVEEIFYFFRDEKSMTMTFFYYVA